MRNLNTNPYLAQQMVQDKNSLDQRAVFFTSLLRKKIVIRFESLEIYDTKFF